jgi:hypothetical protein
VLPLAVSGSVRERRMAAVRPYRPPAGTAVRAAIGTDGAVHFYIIELMRVALTKDAK